MVKINMVKKIKYPKYIVSVSSNKTNYPIKIVVFVFREDNYYSTKGTLFSTLPESVKKLKKYVDDLNFIFGCGFEGNSLNLTIVNNEKDLKKLIGENFVDML